MTNINNSYLNANTLTIAGTKIKQDAEGRFCLNDCHKASGGDPNKRPQMWLRNDQTQDLIKEITDAQICASPLSTVKGGIEQGTYAVKELVYAYAMWISPAFHLQVIRAYDDLINGRLQEPQFAIPKSYSEALRLAADQAEQLKELKPKAEALERIALYKIILTQIQASFRVGVTRFHKRFPHPITWRFFYAYIIKIYVGWRGTNTIPVRGIMPRTSCEVLVDTRHQTIAFGIK